MLHAVSVGLSKFSGLDLYTEDQLRQTSAGSWYATPGSLVDSALRKFQATLNAYFDEFLDTTSMFNRDIWPGLHANYPDIPHAGKLTIDGKIGWATLSAWLAFSSIGEDEQIYPLIDRRAVALNANEFRERVQSYLQRPVPTPHADTTSKTTTTTKDLKPAAATLPEPTVGKSMIWPFFLIPGILGFGLLAGGKKKDKKKAKKKAKKTKKTSRRSSRGDVFVSVHGLGRASSETAYSVRSAIAREKAKRTARAVRAAIEDEKLAAKRRKRAAERRRMLNGLSRKRKAGKK